jgi:hypothetical protein
MGARSGVWRFYRRVTARGHLNRKISKKLRAPMTHLFVGFRKRLTEATSHRACDCRIGLLKSTGQRCINYPGA